MNPITVAGENEIPLIMPSSEVQIIQRDFYKHKQSTVNFTCMLPAVVLITTYRVSASAQLCAVGADAYSQVQAFG